MVSDKDNIKIRLNPVSQDLLTLINTSIQIKTKLNNSSCSINSTNLEFSFIITVCDKCVSSIKELEKVVPKTQKVFIGELIAGLKFLKKIAGSWKKVNDENLRLQMKSILLNITLYDILKNLVDNYKTISGDNRELLAKLFQLRQ